MHRFVSRETALAKAARCLLGLFICALPFPAFAVLGDNLQSVAIDQVRMKGTLRTVPADTYTVHEITAEKGTVVREFVSPAGAVFAVTWDGQFPPDLQQLLGPYYQQAQQELSRAPRRARGPMVIQTSGLVFESYGHQRSFHGRCYVPQMVPNGTPVSQIR